MTEAESRTEDLRGRAAALRVRAIESNRAIAEEFSALWRELNEVSKTEPNLRRIRDRVAGDISHLEKLELAFDVEWLDDAKHSHDKAAGGAAAADSAG